MWTLGQVIATAADIARLDSAHLSPQDGRALRRFLELSLREFWIWAPWPSAVDDLTEATVSDGVFDMREHSFAVEVWTANPFYAGTGPKPQPVEWVNQITYGQLTVNARRVLDPTTVWVLWQANPPDVRDLAEADFQLVEVPDEIGPALALQAAGEFLMMSGTPEAMAAGNSMLGRAQARLRAEAVKVQRERNNVQNRSEL